MCSCLTAPKIKSYWWLDTWSGDIWQWIRTVFCLLIPVVAIDHVEVSVVKLCPGTCYLSIALLRVLNQATAIGLFEWGLVLLVLVFSLLTIIWPFMCPCIVQMSVVVTMKLLLGLFTVSTTMFSLLLSWSSTPDMILHNIRQMEFNWYLLFGHEHRNSTSNQLLK